MTDQETKQVDELEGSELGTKDYWDGRYDMEIRNYKSHGDVGEIWFDESSQDRIIRSITNKLEVSADERIIDIGEWYPIHVEARQILNKSISLLEQVPETE